MFSRKDDPYLISALSRLSTIYTLIRTQAQHNQNADSHFCLEAFADILNKTKLKLPRLFSQIPDYEKEKLSERWFFVQFDLIRYDNILGDQLPFSVSTIDKFYDDYQRHRDYYVQSPHAIILHQNDLYHYNCSVEPHILTILSSSESADLLKQKLKGSISNFVYHANVKEREWVATCIEVLPNPSARLINLNLVEGFLAQARIIAKKMSHDWQKTKNDFLLYSLLAGAGAFAGLILQSAIQLGLRYAFTGAVASTATIAIAVKIALICAALIVIGGWCFALYAYFQARFYNRFAEDLSKINYKNSEHSETQRPASFSYIEQPLATFFQAQRAPLESAFTPDNFARAEIAV